jgi:hypothetical protein
VTTSPRTRFIKHQGRSIVLMDFSGITLEDEAMPVIEEARRFVASRPQVRDLLTLVDATGSRCTGAVIERLKELAKHNGPWVLAGAVVGLNPILRLFLRIITFVTGRKLAVFRTRDEAQAWLVQQHTPPASVPEHWAEPAE